MSSQRRSRQKRGYQYPVPIDGYPLIDVCFQIPDHQRYRAAVRGQLTQMFNFWMWYNDDSNDLQQRWDVARQFTNSLTDTLNFGGACTVDQLQVRTDPVDECSLQYSPDGGDTWFEFADIQDCIIVSPVITNIITNVTNNTTNIDTNITNITNNETNIDLIFDGGIDVNVYPPAPTQSEPDELCGASFYIANQLNDFIQETIIDAATITLEEFLVAVFGLGSFDGSLVNIFWEFIVANINPNLGTEVSDTIDAVAEHFYCNDLDRDLVEIAIDADTGITDDAQAAWIGALRSITDAKIALWAFVGSQDDSNDCSLFVCVCGAREYLPGDPDITVIVGTDETTHWQSVEHVADQAWIKLGIVWNGCPITHVGVNIRAFHLGGDDPGLRNMSQWYNDVIVSAPPYDQPEEFYQFFEETISVDSSGNMTWTCKVAWDSNNNWRLEIANIWLNFGE